MVWLFWGVILAIALTVAVLVLRNSPVATIVLALADLMLTTVIAVAIFWTAQIEKERDSVELSIDEVRPRELQANEAHVRFHAFILNVGMRDVGVRHVGLVVTDPYGQEKRFKANLRGNPTSNRDNRWRNIEPSDVIRSGGGLQVEIIAEDVEKSIDKDYLRTCPMQVVVEPVLEAQEAKGDVPPAEPR